MTVSRTCVVNWPIAGSPGIHSSSIFRSRQLLPSRLRKQTAGHRMTLAELNGLDRATFAATLGGIFEHSPWVADEAWAARPFASARELHSAMLAVVHAAGGE